jgi:hypothetical protein
VTGDVDTARRLRGFVGVNPRGATHDKASVLNEIRHGPRETSDGARPITISFRGNATWAKSGGRGRIAAAEDLDSSGAP